jgi:hypothetical protein
VDIGDIARAIGARILVAGRAPGPAADRVAAGDTISNLLTEATPRTLLVTRLTGAPLVRAADLMDAPAVCIAEGVVPGADVLDAARDRGLAVLVSPAGRDETVSRIARCLGEPGPGGP